MTEAHALPLHMRRAGFDPDPELTALREGEGIGEITTSFGMRAWVVTRFADVRRVLGDPRRFSNAREHLIRIPGAPEFDPEEVAAMRAGNLLAQDPPEHTRLRRFLAPEFTVRRMRRIEPRVREIVADRLEAMARTGPPADLVAEFALPVPSLVICELLGVPYADRDGFQGRTRRMLDVRLSLEERVAVQRESREYLAELIARAQADPGEDLLGALVREHGHDLTPAELVGIANLLLLAGHETTANMLGLGTLALLRHPVQLRLLREDPELVEDAVEELLRWLTIVHAGALRVTTTEVEVAGRVLGPGEMVVCSLPAANRDPSALADPDRLDLTREPIGHLAFGHGVHHCLGAPLARMELRIAFPALLARFPGLRLASEEVSFRSAQVVYGVDALPVAW